jgi:UDP-N-acetylglucosamine--N-acetylmuramyl-(pentapeptide) pyrophosphoryl-undecaprenol N-acetylglucosamine transferase
MKIVFTGGGTGGHIFPIIAIIRELKKLSLNFPIDIYYIGPKDDFSYLLTQEKIKTLFVLSGKLRRYFSFLSIVQNAFDIFVKIPLGILQSFIFIFFLAPDLIFSKGGYGSFPVVIAGKLLGIPIFLHESDSVPGLANRILAKLAVEIFISFSETPYFPKNKLILVGNPIREEILNGDKREAQKIFRLSGEKPVLLILGGSQGAQFINERILEILPLLLEEFEVIHQCGTKNFKDVEAEARVMIKKEQEKYYHLFPFLSEEQLKLAYAAADVILSRAGSGLIFEIAAVGKPAILVPLSSAAQEHQVQNAYLYGKTGAAIVLEEENFTAHFFLGRLRYLFEEKIRIQKMREAALRFARPKAAKIIAYYILEYLRR